MGYTKAGPFVNGSAPGINATFLNNMETWLATLSTVLNPSSNNQISVKSYQTLKSGSPISTGRMIVYESFAPGSDLKIVRISYDQYKNSSATAVDVTLQAPFTQGAACISGLIQGTQLLNGGSAVTIDFITSLSATGDGGTANGTKINAHNIGFAPPFSVIREGGGNAATRSGTLVLVGL